MTPARTDAKETTVNLENLNFLTKIHVERSQNYLLICSSRPKKYKSANNSAIHTNRILLSSNRLDYYEVKSHFKKALRCIFYR